VGRARHLAPDIPEMPPALMWAPGESAAEIKDRKPRQSCSWWHHPGKALMLAAYPPEDTPALHRRRRIAPSPLQELQAPAALYASRHMHVSSSGYFTLVVLSCSSVCL